MGSVGREDLSTDEVLLEPALLPSRDSRGIYSVRSVAFISRRYGYLFQDPELSLTAQHPRVRRVQIRLALAALPVDSREVRPRAEASRTTVCSWAGTSTSGKLTACVCAGRT